MSYNTHRGPNPGLRDVLEAIGNETRNGFAKPIDVLALQEQAESGETTQGIVDLLNSRYGPGIYAMAPIEGSTTGGGVGLPGLIYNTTTIERIDQKAFGETNTMAQARQTLRYQLRPIGYGPSADFYVYSNHYKVGTSSKDQERRDVEAKALRADLDDLGEGVHAILAGDFNIQRSTEDMYITLTASGNGQAFDPINRSGSWSNRESFRDVHTQAPAVDPPSGFTDGGMDNRYDFQLVTDEFRDREGLDYIHDSYHAFGNNGTHLLKGDINTGNGAPPEVLTALMTASDHLPVVADYQLPAILQVQVADVPSTLYVGETFSLSVTIQNAANVVVQFGADELDYMLSTAGDVAGSASGTALALDSPIAHFVNLDTSTPGIKSGQITIASDGQGIGGGLFELPIAYEVLSVLIGDYDANGTVEQGDLDLVLLNWGADAVPAAWIGQPPEGIVDQSELDGVLLNWGRTLSIGAASVPEPSALALVVAALVGWPHHTGLAIRTRQTRRQATTRASCAISRIVTYA